MATEGEGGAGKRTNIHAIYEEIIHVDMRQRWIDTAADMLDPAVVLPKPQKMTFYNPNKTLLKIRHRLPTTFGMLYVRVCR